MIIALPTQNCCEDYVREEDWELAKEPSGYWSLNWELAKDPSGYWSL